MSARHRLHSWGYGVAVSIAKAQQRHRSGSDFFKMGIGAVLFENRSSMVFLSVWIIGLSTPYLRKLSIRGMYKGKLRKSPLDNPIIQQLYFGSSCLTACLQWFHSVTCVVNQANASIYHAFVMVVFAKYSAGQ